MKQRTRIGFWNVRTLNDSDRLVHVVKEMNQYKLDILGLSEVRWNGFGDITAQTGESFIYSGMPNLDDHHKYGVGMVISKKFKNSLLEWQPISERLLKARFKCKVRNVTIIQCYAPTEDADIEVKESFYTSN